MPDAILPPVEEGTGSDDPTATPVPNVVSVPQPAAPVAAATSPRRGGRLASMFAGLNLPWRRQ
jgi:hypothetical protein